MSEYDAYKRLDGVDCFDAWIRLGGSSSIIWKRKLANGVGHASFGAKAHALDKEDEGTSICATHLAEKSVPEHNQDVMEEEACTKCWAMLKARWECGWFDDA